MINRATAGLTVIEVLLSLLILGTAIGGLVQLQGTSLGHTRRAEHLRTVTQIAEAELEWRRQTEIRVDVTACETIFADGYGCSVEINPLGYMGYDIIVNTWAPGSSWDGEPDLSLRAFTTGQRYITGIEPTDGFEVEIPSGPGGGGEDPGAGNGDGGGGIGNGNGNGNVGGGNGNGNGNGGGGNGNGNGNQNPCPGNSCNGKGNGKN